MLLCLREADQDTEETARGGFHLLLHAATTTTEEVSHPLKLCPNTRSRTTEDDEDEVKT